MLVDIVDGRPVGYLTIKEFAEKSGLSEVTIHNQLTEGKLNGIYFQGERRKFWWIPENAAPYKKQTIIKSPKKHKTMPQKEPYPLNLVHEVYEGFEWDQTPDQIAGLEHALAELTDREKNCTILYYQGGMTYREIGDIYHVTTERIRQIIKKAERKLRHPSRFQYIRFGYEGNIARLTPKHELTEEDRKADLLNIPIEEMDLSVRAFNCLKRSDIYIVSDITERLKKGDIIKIRNIGRKTYEEIIEKVAPYYGMTVTEYLDFLISEEEPKKNKVKEYLVIDPTYKNKKHPESGGLMLADFHTKEEAHEFIRNFGNPNLIVTGPLEDVIIFEKEN